MSTGTAIYEAIWNDDGDTCMYAGHGGGRDISTRSSEVQAQELMLILLLLLVLLLLLYEGKKGLSRHHRDRTVVPSTQ